MSNTVKIFGTTFTNVEGIKADDGSGNTLTFTVGGGSGGVNLPTFTITWDNNYENITNVTCDKTYSECVSIFNNDSMTALSSEGYPFVCLGSSHDTTSNLDFLSYLVSFENGPFYDLKYWSNGNITTTSPSIYRETLTATQNGETYYPTNGVFTEVNVDTTLWAYVEYDSNEEKWILDKTYSEIAAAYAAHKDIIVYGNPQSDITTHSDYDGRTLYYIVRAYDIVNNALTQWNYSLTSSGLTEISNTTYVLPPTFQTKSVNPTESLQQVTPDSGYDGLSQVNVTAISSSYVGSGIDRRDSTNLSAAGATVTAPAGYYSTQATKTISSGTEGTPTAIKGTVSNNSVSVTPSVTNTAGYISGSTKTGTAITVSASELVSGSETKTANGTYDVTNLAELVVNVPSGTSMNVQVAQSTNRATSSTYTNLISLTCSTAGTYDIYWDCFRSSISGTSTDRSQLYIDGEAYGSANTTFTNHIQTNHLTGVTLAANQTVAVYARSRGNNYYAYVGTLIIKQTA